MPSSPEPEPEPEPEVTEDTVDSFTASMLDELSWSSAETTSPGLATPRRAIGDFLRLSSQGNVSIDPAVDVAAAEP